MAPTPEQEKQFEEMCKQKLEEQYIKGLRVGILSVSKVIIDKLNDSSKPLMKRIEDVRGFCEIPLNKQNKIEQTLKDAPLKEEQSTNNPDDIVSERE